MDEFKKIERSMFAIIKPQSFNPMIDDNIGRPSFFDPDIYLDAIEMMINADEVERAIWMLDNMPAYYRDNPPARAIIIRERLNRQMFTPIQYVEVLDETGKYEAQMQMPSRGELLFKRIEALNLSGEEPLVCELAPGEHWLKGILTARGRRFDYASISLTKPNVPDLPEDRHNIFVAFEIIEHLANPLEIPWNAAKFGVDFNEIWLSTPYGVFMGGMNNWFDRQIGHLRTFTDHEFHDWAKKAFPSMNKWSLFNDGVMTIVGMK